jgi:ABC-type Fe3+ transport system permease subunit
LPDAGCFFEGLGMSEVLQNIGWAIVYSVVGGLVGIVLVLLASFFLPSLINRMTPNIDEEKEIARGNIAVAEYFGRVVGASILGVSLVVAAAVFAGIIAALLVVPTTGGPTP